MPVLTPVERIGTRVGARYQLVRSVGQGASAVLYCARDHVLGRDVAVKVMKPSGALSGADERARFLGEAQTLARLRHPNLVDVYDVGETDDGVPYVVMELLNGQNLSERIDEAGKLSIEEVLAVCLPLMGALACAHELGVVHRDVKPANIFLHQPRPGLTVSKLLDFGIAKEQAVSGITNSGLALGTPVYMAPEQARGEELGPAADVWALGITLFRCLSGRLPFDATTAAGVLWEATQHGAPRLQSLVKDLDAGVAVAIDRALEPELTRRYADVRSFAHALVRAAARAKLRLPAAPDGLGLPDYARWLSEADAEQVTAAQPIAAMPSAVQVENTNAQPSVVTSTAPIAVSLGARRWPWLFAAAAFVLLGVSSFTAREPERATRVAEEPSVAAPAPIPAQQAAEDSSPVAPFSQPMPAPSEPEVTQPVAAPIKHDEVPAEAPARRPRKRSSRTAPASPAQKAPHVPSGPGLVNQWDW